MKTKYRLLFELIIICCSLFILCSQSTRLSVMAQATGTSIAVTGDSQINQCETKTYTIGVQNNSGNPLTDCFNTAVNGGTARASVQQAVKTPLLAYTPPNVSFNYCEDYVDVNFTVTNIGDGRAHDVWLYVDFGSLTVANVSAGAAYNNIDKRFELTNPLAAAPGPGNTYDLGFRLTFSTWCGGGFPAGDLLWQSRYLDEYDNEFYPPVELGTINAPASSTDLSVSVGGAAEAIQIGDQVTYNVSSTYSGPLACGSGGSVGAITVVDTVPDGFTVVDAGGGTWVPGGGGTGGTVTWTYTPPAALNTSITLQAPDRTQCETYCFTTLVNSVAASGTDCCGCVLDASDFRTTAIECEELVDSEKSAVPTTGIRCDTIQYTNVYAFADNAALDSVDFSQLIFQEDADNEQEYDPGSLAVTLNGSGDITACALSGLTDTTPGAGGNLIINLSNCNTYGSVRNRTLTIGYRLTLTEATASACSGSSFYSWSSLDMGTTGSECLQDGIVYETTVVSIQPPDMSLDITGLGALFHKCEAKTITMDLTQTSGVADPRDVRLVLSGLNYYVVDPGATVCGGSVAPTSCTPALVGDDYVWYFADGFTGSGQGATLQLDVQKRCTGAGDLAATAYYDDNCNDDAIYDDTCSTTATETPALLLSGDLLLEKMPAVYYATTNTVQWKIYVTNRGSGTAYNVWVDDELGAGLDYVSAVVNNMTGVVITADQDHNGNPINGATIAIAQMVAGERREIALNALLVGCSGLTNDVSASWGCVGVDCQVVVTDSATVEIPSSLLINTSTVPTPLAACSTTDGTITLRNAGQTTLYNLQATETLAPGLLYIPGTTRWRLNGGAWNGPAPTYDPSPTTSPLQWTSAQIPALAVANPGDVIEIDFDMEVDCPFSGGDVAVSTQFESPCGQVSTSAESRSTVALREPDVRITKTRVDEPVGCGDLVEWTITVQNTSGYTLPIIWVEDTLDAAFTYDSSVGDPPYTSDNGTFDGVNTVSWELRNVNHNDTVNLTIRATADNSPCSANLDNTVTAWWGCGAADGSSATKPGVDSPDDNLCLSANGVSDTDTPTREPTIGFLDITVNPLSVDSCNDNTQLTVTMENTGPTDAKNVDLVITLPSGMTYNAGTSAVTCGGVTTDPAADPAISGNQLIYYDIAGKANNLCDTVQAAGGNDTLVLVFSVRSNCFVTADMDFDLYYYDCCEDIQYSTTASETMTALYPDLSVTKTPVNSLVDCGNNQAWSITVTNNGTGNAQVVRIEDTLGDWIDYVGSSPAATAMGGQVYGWEINNLAGSGSQTFTITGQLNPDAPQSDCTALLRQNNVRAIWGCGVAGDAVDNDPTTTAYDCTHTTWANAPVATLQMPDLVVTSITPVVAYNADGSFSGAITVRVQNQGDGNSVNNFTVEITDGKGWTGTGTYAGNVPPGGSVDVTIDTSSWAPGCQPCAAPYIFNVTNVDLGDAVCECNEGNNTLGPVVYTPPIPDLVVSDIDFTNVSCTNDNCSGSVSVIVTNVGCAGAANFQVSLATDGCLSFSNQTVVSLAAGANTIVSFPITDSWPDCTVQNCQFTAEVDPTDVVCECGGTNNNRVETYSTTLPDLVVTDIDFSNMSCVGDNCSGFVAVTVQNQGFGSAFGFQVSLATDGCLSFGNQTVWVPLGAGTSTTVVFPVTSPWVNCADCACQFTATVDPTNLVCECDGTNNQRTEEHTQSLPDLRVNSVTPSVTCTGDGNLQGTATVNVSNNGCGDANGAVVRLTSDCGIVFADQTVNLAAGSSADITFNYTPNFGACTCTFTAVIDPGNVIDECDGTNNTLASAPYTLNIPDVAVQSDTLAATCSGDGQCAVDGTVTLVNDGCGANLTANVPVRFTLYDNTGCSGNQLSQWAQTLTGVNLASGGGIQVFTITPQTIAADLCTNSTNCQVSIRVEADYNGSICECDGTNNTYCADNKSVDIPNLEVHSDTLGVSCTDDGQVTVSGTVTLVNNGCGSNLTFDVPMRFTLFDNTGGSGNQLAQWAQSFTGVNIASGGGTQVFTLTPQTLTADLCANSTNCQISIRVEPDYNHSICECDSTDHTYLTDKSISIPDLTVNSVAPSVTSGTVTANVSNIGCDTASGAVVRLASDCGIPFTDQTVDLAASSSQDIVFNFTPPVLPGGCTFTATVDPDNALCECSGTNNAAAGAISRYYYLPIILKNYTPPVPPPAAPDLVVENIIATSNVVTVTIRNAGTAAVNDAFWVDVYFNPSETPSLNHPWDTIASHGVVWGVTTSIPAGGTLVLTTGGPYYFGPPDSSAPPLPVGANVYALVDSVDYSTTYGAVQESNEGNNLYGPVVSTASVGSKEAPVVGEGQSPSMEGLPPR